MAEQAADVEVTRRRQALPHPRPWRRTRSRRRVRTRRTRGRVLGIVGESGCGKSTLPGCMTRLERPDLGQRRSPRRAHRPRHAGRAPIKACAATIQLVFQDPYSSLDPRQRVGAALDEVLTVHRLPTGTVAPVGALLETVGLPPFDRRSLPAPALRRPASARRHRPGARRPPGDPRPRRTGVGAGRLRPRRNHQPAVPAAVDLGLTFVFISHDLGMVRHLADDIAVMYLGKVVEYGPWDVVSDTPRHPYTRGAAGGGPDRGSHAGRAPSRHRRTRRGARTPPPADRLPIPSTMPTGRGRVPSRRTADAAGNRQLSAGLSRDAARAVRHADGWLVMTTKDRRHAEPHEVLTTTPRRSNRPWCRPSAGSRPTSCGIRRGSPRRPSPNSPRPPRPRRPPCCGSATNSASAATVNCGSPWPPSPAASRNAARTAKSAATSAATTISTRSSTTITFTDQQAIADTARNLDRVALAKAVTLDRAGPPGRHHRRRRQRRGRPRPATEAAPHRTDRVRVARHARGPDRRGAARTVRCRDRGVAQRRDPRHRGRDPGGGEPRRARRSR